MAEIYAFLRTVMSHAQLYTSPETTNLILQ